MSTRYCRKENTFIQKIELNSYLLRANLTVQRLTAKRERGKKKKQNTQTKHENKAIYII
jgi:hypothetical protein